MNILHKNIQVTKLTPLKSGTNKQGAWTLWLIVDQDGMEFKTFENIFRVNDWYNIQFKEEEDFGRTNRSILKEKKTPLQKLEERVTKLEEKIEEVIAHYGIGNSEPYG